MLNAIPKHAEPLGRDYYIVKRPVIGTPHTSYRVHRITGEYIGAQISPPTNDDARRMDYEARAAKPTNLARTSPQMPRQSKGHI